MANMASQVSVVAGTWISRMKISAMGVYRKAEIAMLVLACFGAFSVGDVAAEVKLPTVFADHMVIQRDMPVGVRGSADVGETVTVQFRDERRTTVAGKFGRWEVSLSPGAAGGPFVMEIKGGNTIRLKDILVGDVWVASGQSNMEFYTSGVINAAGELKSANLPNVRLFHVAPANSPYPLADLVPARSWVVCTPETAAEFSAVAYFFGKDIQADQHVPIGLIDSTYGGTTAEAWISTRALSEHASLLPAIASWSKTMDREASLIPEKEYENRQRVQARSQGKPEPEFPDHPDEVSRTTPGGLYNAMIAPLTLYPIRGVIWYQGESNDNALTAPIYANLLETLIHDWRRKWGEGDFPFLFVQLPNLKTDKGDGWPEVREAQRETLELKNTGMAITIDVGDPEEVHFRDKQDVGRRLALVARAIVYGEAIEYSGPLFRMQTREEHTMRIWFDHSADLVTKGGPVRGFEIAGADGIFSPADARIDGRSVIVSSKNITEPVMVRYSWKDNPDGNLYNGAGLPASPFQSQPWE